MKKKILFIANVDWFYCSHRLNIGLEAIKDDYEVHLAAKFTGCEDKLIPLGFNLHPIVIDRGSNLIKTAKSFFQIFYLIKKINPDIVHSITIKPIIIGGFVAKFFTNLAFVASVSGLGYLFISSDLKALLIKFFAKFLYKLAFSKKKLKVIFQNKEDLKTISKICNLNFKNISLIRGSGVDLEFFKPTTKQPDENIILFASRLLKSKGLIEFIESAKIMKSKNFTFMVAGKLDKENPDCISIEQINHWERSGIIKYCGYIENMRDLICDSKIVVLPSYYGEGLPKILIEAAACGKPIVTTDHQGCRDAIIPNITGLLIPIRDSRALTSALIKLLNSPDLCKKMGFAARDFAKKNFDIKSVNAKHLSIYSELIKNS